MSDTGADLSTAEAAKLTGISLATLHDLTSGQFSRYCEGQFSMGVRPGSGQARGVTESDAALLAFICEHTGLGLPHGRVEERIRAGEPAEFSWSPAEPTDAPEPSPQNEDRQAHAAARQAPLVITAQR